MNIDNVNKYKNKFLSYVTCLRSLLANTLSKKGIKSYYKSNYEHKSVGYFSVLSNFGPLTGVLCMMLCFISMMLCFILTF